MTQQFSQADIDSGGRGRQADRGGQLGLVPDARDRAGGGGHRGNRLSAGLDDRGQDRAGLDLSRRAACVLVIHAFSIQKWGGFLLELLLGVLYLVAGGWLAFFPFTGIVTLTILLAALFLAEGVVEVIMALPGASARGLGMAAAQRSRRRCRRSADRGRAAELGGLGHRPAGRRQPAVDGHQLHRAGARRQAWDGSGGGRHGLTLARVVAKS